MGIFFLFPMGLHFLHLKMPGELLSLSEMSDLAYLLPTFALSTSSLGI